MVGQEALRTCSFSQGGLYQLQLACVEERFSPSAGSRLQCGDARLLPLLEPAGDTHPAHLKPTADISLREVAFGKQPSGLLAAILQALEVAWRSMLSTHSP